MNKKLEQREKEIGEIFQKLRSEKDALSGRLQQINEEILRLQGEARLISSQKDVASEEKKDE